MKPLVVIPARGGSKGVPRKNIKRLGGKPLIQYTIEAAREVFDDSIIIVSTDDTEIKREVELMGLSVPFLRPDYLATDESGSYEVILHTIEFIEASGYFPDTVVLLQPTSPLRKAHHINEALKVYDSSCEILVSVKETSSNPYYVLFEEDEYGFLRKSKDGKFFRRQDCPKVWELNGAIYIIDVATLKQKKLSEFSRIRKFEMDPISSHDVDSMLDWKLAEVLILERS